MHAWGWRTGILRGSLDAGSHMSLTYCRSISGAIPSPPPYLSWCRVIRASKPPLPPT